MPSAEVNAPIDAPRGLAGVVVTDTELGDVRGIEGFYHYRQYSAVELAHGPQLRGRLVPDGPRGAARRRRSSRPSRAETAALRTLPDGRAGRAARDRPCRCALRPARRAAHRAVAARRDGRASGRCTTSTPTAAAPTRSPPAPAVPTLLTALHRLGQGLRARRAARRISAYAANYLYMLTGVGAGAGTGAGDRAVSDLHHRPRLQRLDLHRTGHRLDRRRPRGLPRRRRRRALRAAARRCAQPGAGHARRDRHPRPHRPLDP